ncbi:MAG TPA: hypothetical protein VJ716_00940 [Gaiellaceae bacterium]|nr:hypothetical protein [Gaiellaceae bacterium]
MIHTRPSRRRIARAIPVLWIAALLAVCCAGTAVAAAGSHATSQAKLSGKWKGSYSGAVSGHFTIHWKQTGTKLSGTIALSKPKGKYGIGGHVRQGKIKFGAVGVGATYKGKVHGTQMSGTWNSPQGGGKWSAHKVS